MFKACFHSISPLFPRSGQSNGSRGVLSVRHPVDVSSRKPAVPGVEGHDPEWLARTIRRRKATHLPSPRSPTDLNKLRRAFSFGDSLSQIFGPVSESGVDGYPFLTESTVRSWPGWQSDLVQKNITANTKIGCPHVSSTDPGRGGDDLSTAFSDRVHGQPE